MSVSKLLAFCLVTLVSTAAQPEESPKLPPVIRTPLGTSSSQVLLAKFTVSNLAKSYDFYTKIIGLKWALSAGQQQPPAPQPPSASQPAFIEIPLNFSGSLADPFFVIVQRRGDTPTPETARLSWVGFKVPDAPSAVRRAREAGYEVLREPPTVGPGEMSFGAIRDPDGYSVEFIQAANYPPTGR